MIIVKSPKDTDVLTVMVHDSLRSCPDSYPRCPVIRGLGEDDGTKIGSKTGAKVGEDVDVLQMPSRCLDYDSVSTDMKLQEYLRKAKTQTNNVAMRKYAKLLSFLQMQAAG